MTDLTSRLIVRLIDGVSAPASKAATSLRRLIGVSEKTAVAGRGTMNALTRDVGLLNRGVQRVTSSASMPLGLIGAMGARTVYEYAKVGNAMQAVTGLTDDQRKKVEGLAVQLNEKFPNTLGDIMGAAFELGRAGLDFDQIMGGLKGTLQLGLAGDLAVAEASDISTNILTAMRLPAKGAEQVAASLQKVNDVLAYVATNSNTDVRMMGETLKYVGPIAAASGLSLDEVGAASMIMAKNGIRASEAGVAMRSALVRMARPTKDMIKSLERLDINLADFVTGGRQIFAKDIIGSLKADGVDASEFEAQIDAALADPKLQKSTAAMTAAIAGIIDEAGSVMDRGALAEAITDTLTSAGSEVNLTGFLTALRERGVDPGDFYRIFDARQGSRLQTLLAGDLVKALEDVTSQSENAAATMAEIRMKGIVGDVHALIAAWDKLMIKIGEAGVLKTVSEAFQSLSKSITDLSASNPRLLELGTYAAMATVALVPLGMAFSALGGIASVVVGGIGLIGGAIALLGGPVSLVVGLLAALGIAIWSNWDDISKMLSFFGEKIANVASAIGNGIVAAAEWVGQGILKIGEAIGNVGASLFDAGARLLQSLWEGMKSVFSGIMGWAAGVPGRIGSAIKGAVGLGGGESSGGAAPPARARGGPVSRGRSYLVGEHRPEIFTPGASGYVTSRVPKGGAGAGPITISQTFNVSGAGDPKAFVETVKRELQNDLQEALRGVFADARFGYGY